MAEPILAGFVPGLPHLLAEAPAPGWKQLADATRQLGEEWRTAGVESVVVVSTQWFSVLGLQVQMRPELRGTRVDENWYAFDFGTIDYQVRTDVTLSQKWLDELRAAGFQARPTEHAHFPVDTGLVVALQLLDPERRFSVAQASLNLYGDAASVERLGACARRAVQATGRRTAMLAVSGLSSDPLRQWIEPAQDRISSPQHERWDRRILDLLASGQAADALALREEYARAASADSQLRALGFLQGAGALQGKARVRAYAPVWGTGGAVIDWSSSE